MPRGVLHRKSPACRNRRLPYIHLTTLYCHLIRIHSMRAQGFLSLFYLSFTIALPLSDRFRPRDIIGLFEDDDDVQSTFLTAEDTQSILSSRSTSTIVSGVFSTESRSTGTSQQTSKTTATSTSATLAYIPEAPATPPAEATEWKVIGIAIISITFVATVILAVVFFDSWWGFLRDLIFGKKHDGGSENLVPDWEKRSWEHKLANEDGHRYPTLASLDSMAKESPEKVQLERDAFHSKTVLRLPYVITTPQISHSPTVDPHPLEPLIRRPSTRTDPATR